TQTIQTTVSKSLENLIFVVTGSFEKLSREDMIQLIQKHSGKAVSSPNKKTNYIVVGENPGDSKVKKGNELNIQFINLQDLLNLIENGKKY
ncbi:MAG: NAD-dependent DNA ligase LigA, partial [Bacteroidia bacterium]|nr:NAD-dependent DNA ligase LigA [Bacteroidia bacterium]